MNFIPLRAVEMNWFGADCCLTPLPHQVPDYIQRALCIPPPAPRLGMPRRGTLSTSSFYKNHHRLFPLADNTDPVGWRPRGVLVSTLAEHTGPVNGVSLSRDNLFLASGSDDGTVKVWDCNRFKASVHPSSQLTYPHEGRVTSLTVCDSSHSVASASDNGSVHVFKVEYAAKAEDSSRASGYTGLSEVKKIDSSEHGQVLAVEHFNTATESLLVYGTQRGAVCGWDLRARIEPFCLKIDPSLGMLTAMCVGPTAHCLIVGTSRGFVLVWDLRFQIAIQVWRHSAQTSILSLTPEDAATVLPRKRTNQLQHSTKGPLVFVSAQ